MERLGFLIGVVALAVALVPDVWKHVGFLVWFEKSELAKFLFWFGIILVIWGGVALLRTYITYIDLLWIWNAMYGRYSLQKELTLIERYGPRVDERKLLDWLVTMAGANRGTIYGELGSDKSFRPHTSKLY